MIKAKIFVSKGLGYEEEENQLNLFLKNIQEDGKNLILSTHVRNNSIVIFYEEIKNDIPEPILNPINDCEEEDETTSYSSDMCITYAL